MKPDNAIRLARLTRPIMRRRPPVLYRMCKWMLAACYPKGRPGASRQLVAPFDGGLIHVDTSSSIEYHLLFRGCHESAITDLIQKVVKPGYICLDVGANVGAHTLVLAKAVGPEGRVIAFEPHPGICARLRENVTLNNYANVAIVEAALSDKDGVSPFFGFGDGAFHRGISSLLPDEEATKRMEVRTASFSSVAKEERIDSCDFIKIDVEGFEAVVLKELDGLIERCRPYVIFEYRKRHWEKFGGLLDETLSTFRSLGYTLQYIRKNRAHSLQGPVPDSCEIICEPERKENHG